jgi:O-antigen/teichoic acid export membrane protein
MSLPGLGKFIRSVGSQWASVIYGSGITFLVFVFLARKLGPSSLAVFLYIQTIGTFFSILQDGGFQALLFREKVAATAEIGLTTDELVSGYFSYLFLATLAGVAVVLVFPFSFKTGFLLALCYFGLRCITSLVSSLLKGQGQFEKEALWRFQLNTLRAVPVFVLIGLVAPTPENVFLGLIIGQLLIFTTRTGRNSLARPKLKFPPWRIWKTCLCFIIISGASTIYFKSSIVLLKHLQPDMTVTGCFGAALQIVEGVVLMAAPVAHLAFRHMRLSWLDSDIFSRRFNRILLSAVALSLLLATAGMAAAPWIIRLAYGQAYQPAGGLLRLLLVSLLFLLPNFVLTQAIIALNGERYYALAACLCALFNLGLNLILIPACLTRGAAFSTIATEALLTVLLGGWFLLRRRAQAAGPAL